MIEFVIDKRETSTGEVLGEFGRPAKARKSEVRRTAQENRRISYSKS